MFKKLSRRTFLRGTGVALALPSLEAMAPSAFAATAMPESGRKFAGDPLQLDEGTIAAIQLHAGDEGFELCYVVHWIISLLPSLRSERLNVYGVYNRQYAYICVAPLDQWRAMRRWAECCRLAGRLLWAGTEEEPGYGFGLKQ